MSIFLILLILFIILEVFESTWQKSDTLFGVIYNNYHLYKKNTLLYFVFNTTFIYSIFLAFYLNNFGFWMSSIIVVKFFDIALRLSLVHKLDSGQKMEEILPINVKMNNLFRYINVLIYPLCFIFAVV